MLSRQMAGKTFQVAWMPFSFNNAIHIIKLIRTSIHMITVQKCNMTGVWMTWVSECLAYVKEKRNPSKTLLAC